jgi:hypothetical protein
VSTSGPLALRSRGVHLGPKRPGRSWMSELRRHTVVQGWHVGRRIRPCSLVSGNLVTARYSSKSTYRPRVVCEVAV